MKLRSENEGARAEAKAIARAKVQRENTFEEKNIVWRLPKKDKLL